MCVYLNEVIYKSSGLTGIRTFPRGSVNRTAKAEITVTCPTYINPASFWIKQVFHQMWRSV